MTLLKIKYLSLCMDGGEVAVAARWPFMKLTMHCDQSDEAVSVTIAAVAAKDAREEKGDL
jgi:hypothetical protein|tara:strand:+ start:10315 stop:10494 length:180 start_codon:yes stop_codon:yes gene_type:complete